MNTLDEGHLGQTIAEALEYSKTAHGGQRASTGEVTASPVLSRRLESDNAERPVPSAMRAAGDYRLSKASPDALGLTEFVRRHPCAATLAAVAVGYLAFQAGRRLAHSA